MFKKIFLPTLALTVICAILGSALALTNDVTKDKIAEQEKQKQAEAMQSAIAADEYKQVGEPTDGCTLFTAEKGGKTVGYVVSTSESGYGGKIQVMVGISDDAKTVENVSIVSCDTETAGIGQKVANEDFRSRFKGKDSKNVMDVDVITGASISSKAVKTAVKKAIVFCEGQVSGK